ncbi:MAG TPA: hypothetical protein VH008_30905 [Pseudonocardia sp.]|nr:hypothetical protein [Pseudonocardia sp.]
MNPIDLRQYPVEPVLARVERILGTRPDRATAVRKRRTVGGRDRPRDLGADRAAQARAAAIPGSGTGAAAELRGVARAAWLGGLTWPADELDARRHADETSLVTARPAHPAGPPQLTTHT